MGATAAYSNRIRDIRQARGLTQEALAALLGEDTSIATVSRLESGRMTLTLPWLQRIGEALNVSPHEIIARAGEGLRLVPVVGMGAATNWQQAIREPEKWLPVPDTVGGDKVFAVRPGDSSLGVAAATGTYAIVDPEQNQLADGRMYLIRLGESVVFRRYRADPPRFVSTELKPQPDIQVGSEPFTVVGRVTYMGLEL